MARSVDYVQALVQLRSTDYVQALVQLRLAMLVMVLPLVGLNSDFVGRALAVFRRVSCNSGIVGRMHKYDLPIPLYIDDGKDVYNQPDELLVLLIIILDKLNNFRLFHR